MTGLYWSTLLNCRAHANIHIIVIRCIFNCCFHPAVSFCCVYFVTERKARNIYLHIHPNAAQVRSDAFSLKCCVCVLFSWIASRRAKLQSCATVPHWSTRSIAGPYIRSYEIKRLLDNKNIWRQFFLLSIMSTNHCSPTSIWSRLCENWTKRQRSKTVYLMALVTERTTIP